MKNKKILAVIGRQREIFPSSLFRLYRSFETFSKSVSQKSKLNALRKLSQKNELIIVALDTETKKALDSQGFECRLLKDYAGSDFEKRAQEEGMRLMNEFPDSRLKGMTEYKGISLWFAEEFDAWSSFFYRIAKTALLAESAIKNEKPGQIVILDNSMQSAIIAEIAESMGIPVKKDVSIIAKIKEFAKDFISPFAVKTIVSYPLRRLKTTKKDEAAETKRQGKVLIIKDIIEPLEAVSCLYDNLKNTGFNAMVIALEDERKRCIQKNITFRTFHSYLTDEIIKNRKSSEKSFHSSWHEIERNHDFRKNEYHGVRLWRYTKNMLEFFFLSRFPDLAFLADMAEEAINREAPSLVILWDDIGPFGKTIAMVCKKKKIPCLTAQHGIFGGMPVIKSCSDKVAVYGDYARSVFIKNGTPEEKIIITGNIKFDLLLRKKFDKKRVFEKLGVPENRKLIVLATTSGSTNERIFRMALSAAKKMKGARIVAKLHPAERDISGYIRIMKEMNFEIPLVKDFDLYELLNACDLLLTVHSTVGMEAAVMGKPMILLDVPEDSFVPQAELPYYEEGVALKASDEKELEAAMAAVFSDKGIAGRMDLKRKEFVRKHAFRLDGKAAERIAKLAEKMRKK